MRKKKIGPLFCYMQQEAAVVKIRKMVQNDTITTTRKIKLKQPFLFFFSSFIFP